MVGFDCLRTIDTFGVLITVRRSEDGIDELVGRVPNIVTHTLDDHPRRRVNDDGKVTYGNRSDGSTGSGCDIGCFRIGMSERDRER